MASPLIPSALDPQTQAFPVLTEAQISRVRPGSKLRHAKKDEILFNPGDTNIPFFVLLSGGMEIVQPDLAGERQIATHGPGGFTGEMTMISGQRCLVRGRVTEPGEFLELSADGLRSLVAKDAELSEIFIGANHPIRRLRLSSARGRGNRHLDGFAPHSTRHYGCANFLSRNEYPLHMHLSLDPDQDLARNFSTMQSPLNPEIEICHCQPLLALMIRVIADSKAGPIVWD